MVGPWKKFQNQRKAWGGLVGRFVLAFGDIENVTYLALSQLPRDSIFKSTSTLGFGKRVDLVIEIVRDHPEVSAFTRALFIRHLKEAKVLSDTRNTLAHSPLVLSLYRHPEWTHAELGIGTVRNSDKPVTLQVLRSKTREVEALAKKLHRAYSRVYKSVKRAKAA